jgi:transcriptional regulator with XRE-family HTH domain
MSPADLVAARERMGLTQARLAELLGVQRLAVVRWENGQRAIPPYLHLALKALNSPVSAAVSAAKKEDHS